MRQVKIKILTSVFISLINFGYTQIHPHPGGGPNPYGINQSNCSGLGPEIEVYKNVFIKEIKEIKPKIEGNEFFSIVQELYVQESIKALPNSIQAELIKCTYDQIETLRKILESYKDAIKTDETCRKYFETTKNIEYLEKYIQLYEQK